MLKLDEPHKIAVRFLFGVLGGEVVSPHHFRG
jgi:hypothetical protein